MNAAKHPTATDLVGWKEIEDYQFPSLSYERITRKVVRLLIEAGYLPPLSRNVAGQVVVSVIDIENAWLARENARVAAAMARITGGRGRPRDPVAPSMGMGGAA